ncbi:MAG: hypothetical protein RL326_7, partial [Pseudomonadota bacterium]
VGEVGAFAIGVGSDYYVSSLERNFACSKIPDVTRLANSACKRAGLSRDAFSRATNNCGIYFDAAFDRCGPIGLKEFTPVGAGCEKDISCDDPAKISLATDKFTTAAEDTLACLNQLRTKMLYEKLCNSGKSCISGGQDWP